MINLLKFTHLLFVLGIFSLAIYCFALIGSKIFLIKNTNTHDKFNYLNKIMVVFCVFAMLTGTLLVYPKHFTFHTPWIQAAYLFTFIVGFSAVSFILFKMQREEGYRWVWRLAYLVLISILIVITHDAVTKTTFIFPSM